MILGFTGTRHGMSASQMAEFVKFVEKANAEDPIEEFHHGDCLGADAEAHDWIVRHLRQCQVYVHPSIHARLRAYRRGRVHLPAPPLERNRRIVDQCTFLVAVPNTPYEELRSGTWTTVRYASKINRPMRIIFP